MFPYSAHTRRCTNQIKDFFWSVFYLFSTECRSLQAAPVCFGIQHIQGNVLTRFNSVVLNICAQYECVLVLVFLFCFVLAFVFSCIIKVFVNGILV